MGAERLSDVYAMNKHTWKLCGDECPQPVSKAVLVQLSPGNDLGRPVPTEMRSGTVALACTVLC